MEFGSKYWEKDYDIFQYRNITPYQEILKVKELPTSKTLRHSLGDDWIDPISHVYSVLLLIACATIVSTAQLVGDTISCWCPAEFKESYRDYTNRYCWIKDTYYIPMQEYVPTDVYERHKAEITYYQWVPLIFLFQALLFKAPHWFWATLHGRAGLNVDHLCSLAAEADMNSKKEERVKKLELLTSLLQKWCLMRSILLQLRTNADINIKTKMSKFLGFIRSIKGGPYLTGLYLSMKLLYLINAISQFFLLNRFMSMDYNMYGFEYIKRLHRDEPLFEKTRFPRVTLCDFEIRQMTNIQRYTVQCVLPINNFNEKIFLVLWFWFFLVAFLAGYSLLKWTYYILIRKQHFVRSCAIASLTNIDTKDKKSWNTFSESYLRNDGCFVLQIIQVNSSKMLVSDLVVTLWNNYQAGQQTRREMQTKSSLTCT